MNTYVVYCHPMNDSFISAARDRALAGLSAAGHEVRLTDLYAEDFRPELSAWERAHHLDPPETKPEIATHAENLRWCDTLILVHPTWWSGQPAMLKGWIDRVWVTGVAYELPAGSTRIRPLLRNIRRLVVVTSHGSPKWMNALQGEGGKRVVGRALRVLCHRRARTSWIALYNIDRSSDAERAHFLDRVERKCVHSANEACVCSLAHGMRAGACKRSRLGRQTEPSSRSWVRSGVSVDLDSRPWARTGVK